MTDIEQRLAELAERGLDPHKFVPGMMRHKLTVCAYPGCDQFEAFIAHDPDLPRPRSR